MKNMSLKKRFLIFVGIPTLLAVGYFVFLATDMYISEARFSIRGAEGPTGPELLAIFGHTGGIGKDSYIVQEYIQSMSLLREVDFALGLKEHFQKGKADFFSRLDDDATSEEFLKYYRKVVKAGFDSGSGIFTLQTRALTPEMAQHMGQVIIDLSEKLVNQIRSRGLQDSLALAREELHTAEQRISRARDALKKFRTSNNALNPEATAGAVLSLVAEMEGEVAKNRAELAEARSYMRDNSAQVKSLQARIAAMESQIALEKARLTGSDSRVLNEVVGDYEKLMIEQEFAQKQYVSALASLEAARIRAQSKSRYLVAFAEPTLPQEALYPRRFISVLLVFGASILTFGIASLVIAAVREHAGF